MSDRAQNRADRVMDDLDMLARDICDTYYLTVDPNRKMTDAYDKIGEKTRVHWKAQARLMKERGWVNRDRLSGSE